MSRAHRNRRRHHGAPPPAELRRRRRRHPALGWSLLVSAMLIHLMIPAIYLLFRPPEIPPQPVEVEVAFVDEPTNPQRKTTTPQLPRHRPTPVRRLRRPRPRPQPQRPKPRDPEKPKEKKPDELQPMPPVPRLKMVEVNTPETEKPPENARFLSDKDRRVDRETRARITNLRRDDPKPKPHPEPEAKRRPDPGARRPKVAETKRREAKRDQQTESAKREKQRARRRSRLLRMRREVQPRDEQRDSRLGQTADGSVPTPRKQRRGHKRRKLQLALDHRSYDRIYGADAARERRRARLKPSHRKGGRVHRKWKRIQAALENFVPEVRPGNQTALGTRANPFAVYIARMHRKIHKLWGFGFLVDLDSKPDSHPLNRMSLWTMVEVVVKPDGTVAKATVVRPSGRLTFDVAALDAVFSGAPYPRTPRKIRSKDGYVYLHWRFHRNHRQCGTFGVDPYILTKPPEGPIDGNLREIGRHSSKPKPRRIRRLNRPPRYAVVPDRSPSSRKSAQAPDRVARERRAKAARKAAAQRVSPGDPGAADAAQAFVDAFRSGKASAMAGACSVPFKSAGRIVARSRERLKKMFGSLLAETSSRHASRTELMTVMDARRKLGRVPRGAAYGKQMLLGRVSLGGSKMTLILQRRGKAWHVIGLNR